MTTRVSAEMTTGVVKTTEKASKTTLTTSAANDGLLVQLDSSGLLPAAFIPPSTVKVKEASSDPANPAEGEAVIWMSDGTGTGDDGDILIKITAGGVTKTATLVDFSGV
tara:strand:- start:322 stop:648 length:327 start_codon:yes stop_codon:yes gene_type:complete